MVFLQSAASREIRIAEPVHESCCVRPVLGASEQQCVLLQMSCRDLLLSSSVLGSVWIPGTVVLHVFPLCLFVPPGREL